MASKARKPKPFALTPPEPLESQIQRQIGDYLNWDRRVCFWWRQNVGAGQLLKADGSHTRYLEFAFVGCPDILGWLKDGTMLLIEVKKQSVKKASEAQERTLKLAKDGGCVALVARSYEDVKRAIDAHFAGK